MQALSASPEAKVYFASDFHLGAPSPEASRSREKALINWLASIEADAGALFLMGDLFDFWFEYQKVVPKGYTRLLGKLALMSDNGLPLYIFSGNHDLWMRDYLQEELGATVYHSPQWWYINGDVCYLAHGDGLGPGDHGYKLLKKVFTNRLCQQLFRWLHPDLGIRLANYFSGMSRNAQDEEAIGQFLGEDREYLIQHARALLTQHEVTYFIFGHRHYPLHYGLSPGSAYVNLGDWLWHNTYAVHDGSRLQLITYTGK